MESFFTFLAYLVLIGIVSANVENFGTDEVITWCTTSLLEQEKCERLANVTQLDKGLFRNETADGRNYEDLYLELKCKRAFDNEECMNWIDRGEATLLALDAGEVYIAGRYHSLVPIVQELYGRGEPYQYAVAVVKKGGLPGVQPGTGLRGLRGARACFPSVGALAGWVMPIHVLMQEGGLKTTDCNNHVKSALAYFGDSCAPNSLKDMYNPIGDNSDKLCSLCAGGAGVRCTLADPHAGYAGALRCLVSEGGGDVAFTRDTALQHALLAHRMLGGVSEEQFELVCRDGSRAAVTQWEGCNWGRVPADAVLTTSAASVHQRARYQKYLQKLVQLYGEVNSLNRNSNRTADYKPRDPYGNYYSTSDKPRFPYDPYSRNKIDDQNEEYDGNRVSTLPPYRSRLDPSGRPIELPFRLFQSNTTTDLLLQDATVNFRILSEEEQAASHILNNQYVGSQAEQAVTGIRDCPVKRFTLCVTSDQEMDKCNKMRTALKAASLVPALSCWRGHSARECARAVAAARCDALLADAADMLHAAARHALVPFMQEVYTNGERWYYAVAVAKEQDASTELPYLRAKNTCHSGLGLAAGWTYPLAYLIANGWIRSYGCDGAHAAAQYFSKSCAPGALSTEYVDAGTVPHDNLCHLCHGASYRRCRRDASEPYYGAVGALRCMVEGGGDVAFTRHTAPAQLTAGRREWWARDLLPDDLQLLCADGTRAATHEYARCNLGRVPGAVLLGRANHTELDVYSDLLIYAQQFYGADTADEFSFSMFHSPAPYFDLIFSDVAVRLHPLPHSQRSAELVAGPALLRAARIVSCDAPQAGYYVASDPNFLSAGVKNSVSVAVISVVMAIVLVK